VIETPVGAMEGKYCMIEDNGNNFEAPIPPFTLAVPGILH
jgi:ApaG protein